MKTLDELYILMNRATEVRRRIVAGAIEGSTHREEVSALESVLGEIRSAPRKGRAYLLAATYDSGSAAECETDIPSVETRLEYEIGELEKDIAYFHRGDGGLREAMEGARSGVVEEAARLSEHLSRALAEAGGRFGTFITDRDGTVVNYCARYRSSGQAAYNALYLSRFAAGAARRSVILSSGPLDGGLLDLSVIPPGVFVYAGSKGREYCDERGRRGACPIPGDQLKVIESLNDRLDVLLCRPANRIFSLIGSAVQHKHGQTTVARQDTESSIPERESTRFLNEVTELVREVDPELRHLRIEDTGKDIEITLTVAGGDRPQYPDDAADDEGAATVSAAPAFDKGSGVRFLNESLELEVESGSVLVCGDTASDLPMLDQALRWNPNVTAVFVTEDRELRRAVRRRIAGAFFVSTPDALVTALNASSPQPR